MSNLPEPDAPPPALLRERMVAGQLPRERLQLGHALGSEACRVALGRPLPEPPGPWDPPPGEPSLERWGRSFGPYGPAPMLRIAVALVRHVADSAGEDPALRAALAAADEFFTGEVSRDAVAWVTTCEEGARGLARASLQATPDERLRRARLALLPVLRALQTIVEQGAPERAVLDALYLRALEHLGAAPELDLAAAQRAARDEVLPWALGLEPPESKPALDDVFGDQAP